MEWMKTVLWAKQSPVTSGNRLPRRADALLAMTGCHASPVGTNPVITSPVRAKQSPVTSGNRLPCRADALLAMTGCHASPVGANPVIASSVRAKQSFRKG
jgi:hypothetical protein